VSFAPTTGRGPLGTGVHLLRLRDEGSGVLRAQAFFTVLFLPLVPLGEWRLQATPGPGGPAAAPLDERGLLTVRDVAPPRLLAFAWVAGGALALLLALLPGYAALTWPVGSRFVELGAIFASLALLLGGLGLLDQTRIRVPLRVALRALRRRERDTPPA
jgi:hypothetical protein